MRVPAAERTGLLTWSALAVWPRAMVTVTGEEVLALKLGSPE
jgi:hypothetical protein